MIIDGSREGDGNESQKLDSLAAHNARKSPISGIHWSAGETAPERHNLWAVRSATSITQAFQCVFVQTVVMA
jgi:hypothetical protein